MSSRNLAGLQALKMEMGGLCDGLGYDPRMVDVDTAVLISWYGLVRDLPSPSVADALWSW
jgi:hypothetical protein